MLDVFDVKASDEQNAQILRTLKTSSKFYSKNFDKLDVDNIRLFSNSSQKIAVALIMFKEENNSYGVKGTFINGEFIFLDEYLAIKKDLSSSEEDETILLSSKEAISIKRSPVYGEHVSSLSKEMEGIQIIKIKDDK